MKAFKIIVSKIIRSLKLWYRCKNLNVKFPFFGAINNTSFEGNNRIGKNTILSGCNLGKYSYVGDNSVFVNVKIGRFCSISSGVKAGLGIHPSSKFVSTSPVFYSTKMQAGSSFVETNLFEENLAISIGHDVWIGTNVVIMDGVSIGDGAIVGSGAIITKDVEPYSIIGGIPGKIIKKRFTEDQIKFLLAYQWWNKEDSWLRENIDCFGSIDVFKKCISDNK